MPDIFMKFYRHAQRRIHELRIAVRHTQDEQLRLIYTSLIEEYTKLLEILDD